MPFLMMGGVCCDNRNYEICLSRIYFLCPDWMHCMKWSCEVPSVGDWLKYGHLCFMSNCIFPVGYLWWMKHRDVLCSAWGSLLIMFLWVSQSLEFMVVIDHLYYCMRNSRASSAWECCLMWWSTLLCMYFVFTYNAKGMELTWVLMGIVAEVVARWSASIFRLAYINRSFLFLSSWWPNTWCIVNWSGIHWRMIFITSGSLFLYGLMNW